MMRIKLLLTLVFCLAAMPVGAAPQAAGDEGLRSNLPEREEWYKDLALGMFIHWSVDSQLGSVISHSLAGASADYADRFFNELPRTFEPKRFDPAEWARLARVGGMKYVMFTTKHHSGFSMFDTKTTPFNIMNTPYGKDATAEVVEAFRKEGLAVGFYFSPEDFWFIHQQGHPIARRRDYADPSNNLDLREHNKKQIEELFNNYGPIDLAFLDAFDQADAVTDIWAQDRNVVITRGAMATPEQKTPDTPMMPPWEACYTLGTQWHFKPTNEEYKSGNDLIRMLVEIRAKGGTLLLNVGPEPSGEIPFEQERRIREMALWLFVNHEAIYAVRPWHVVREGDIWFTRAKDSNILYAIITGEEDWARGARKAFVLKSARATALTEISVLGHGGELVEYRPDADPTPTFEQKGDELHISVVRAQRLYNNHRWPNPVVVKLSNVEPAR